MITLALLLSSPWAQAGNWLVCDFTVAITGKDQDNLIGNIIRHSQGNAPACQAIGPSLVFQPETADYQHVLPRSRWPKPGQPIHLRYRQLDGYCKGDGNTHPCTIRHYSLLTHSFSN